MSPRRTPLRIALPVVAALLLALAAAAIAAGAPAVKHRARHRHTLRTAAAGGCPVFPADNPINQEVATLPESPNSQAYVESIGLEAHLHPDFGNNPGYGIPFEVVGAGQPKVPVKFTAYRERIGPRALPGPVGRGDRGRRQARQGRQARAGRAGRLLHAV